MDKCERCDLPLVELDAYGERLRGCVGCNTWRSSNSGEWRHLPDEDIAAWGFEIRLAMAAL
jgi:hypothetical protein